MIGDNAPPPTGLAWRLTLIIGWAAIAFGIGLVLKVWLTSGLRGAF